MAFVNRKQFYSINVQAVCHSDPPPASLKLAEVAFDTVRVLGVKPCDRSLSYLQLSSADYTKSEISIHILENIVIVSFIW